MNYKLSNNHTLSSLTSQAEAFFLDNSASLTDDARCLPLSLVLDTSEENIQGDTYRHPLLQLSQQGSYQPRKWRTGT